MTTISYQLLANVVLLLHFAVVIFIVGALPLIVVGNRAGWSWVNDGWFRAIHLAAIVVVAASSWVGIECPLTTLERWLRRQAGSPSYGEEGFIEHWVTRLLFYDGPWWAFAVAYTLFALLVVAVWIRYPPRTRVTPRRTKNGA